MERVLEIRYQGYLNLTVSEEAKMLVMVCEAIIVQMDEGPILETPEVVERKAISDEY